MAFRSNQLRDKGISALVLLCLLAIQSMPANAVVPGCEGAGPYTPYAAPVVDMRSPVADVTVIVMHGKGGSPNATFLQDLSGRLAAAGYNVIAPWMTWSRNWDGTHCQGLNYLDSLVDAERAAGRRVVVVGHSMGGMHALIYGSLAGSKIPAVVAIAPGHFLSTNPNSSLMQAIAPYVSKAQDLVMQGLGDVVSYELYTLNGSQLQQTVTTPNIYLSFHSLSYFPAISDVLSQVNLPVHWIAGSEDPLTSNYITYDMFGMMPYNAHSLFEVLPGDHYTVVPVSGPAFDAWFRGWWPPATPTGPTPVPPGNEAINYLLLD